MTTRSHCLLFHKRSTDWDSALGYKQVISHNTRRISLLLTLVLGFASDSCSNNDILLVVGYNYNIYIYIYVYMLQCFTCECMYVALYVVITIVFVMMLDTLQYIIMIILQMLIVIYVIAISHYE